MEAFNREINVFLGAAEQLFIKVGEIRPTAPKLHEDPKKISWGPNGDLISSEMGTLDSRNGDPNNVYLTN